MKQPERHRSTGHLQLCPGCGTCVESIEYRYRYDAGESFIYRCGRCSLEFLRPLPLAEVEERKMDSVGDAEMFNSPLLRRLHERLIIGPEIAKVRSLLGKKDFSMLDVGCGTGWIARIWANAGARVTGLEPSQPRAELARRRGLRVLSCYAEQLDTEESFDLIVVRHVVEHLESPRSIIESLMAHLTPGGVLLIVLPNIDCIGRRLFDTRWTWVLPWHCNFFSPRSLKTLLEGCGCDVISMYQTPSPLYYPEAFARCFPALGSSWYRSPLFMLPFAPLIGLGYLTGLSDNLTAFARKSAG